MLPLILGRDRFTWLGAAARNGGVLAQVRRSKHKEVDGQECCTCEFEVRWLGGPLVQQRQIVVCGDICIRIPGDIEDDPTIREFISKVKAINRVKAAGSQHYPEKGAVLVSKRKSPSTACEEGGWNGHEQSCFEDHKKRIRLERSKQIGGCQKPPQKKAVNESSFPSPSSQSVPKSSEASHSCRLPDLNGGVPTQPADTIIHIHSDEEDDYEPLTFRRRLLRSGSVKDSSPGENPLFSMPHGELCKPLIETEAGIAQRFTSSFQETGATCKLQASLSPKPEDEQFKPAMAHRDRSTNSKSSPDLHSFHATSCRVPEELASTLNDRKPQASNRTEQQPSRPPSAANDFCELSEEYMFSCVGHKTTCSGLQMARRCCFKGGSSPCDTLSFIPVAPFHLTSMWAHNKCGHISTSNRSAASQTGTKVADSKGDSDVKSENRMGNIDIVDKPKAYFTGIGNQSSKGAKSMNDAQLLLVENLDKSITPSKALKALHRVSSGVLSLYLCPSLEYETTRKGYICFRDPETADAAFLAFTVGKFMMTSSKGRPWVVSRAHCHSLDSTRVHNLHAAAIFQEENLETEKEDADGDLLIHYKGTAEFIMALSRKRLFEAQQAKLRSCYEMFSSEERALETELARLSVSGLCV